MIHEVQKFGLWKSLFDTFHGLGFLTALSAELTVQFAAFSTMRSDWRTGGLIRFAGSSYVAADSDKAQKKSLVVGCLPPVVFDPLQECSTSFLEPGILFTCKVLQVFQFVSWSCANSCKETAPESLFPQLHKFIWSQEVAFKFYIELCKVPSSKQCPRQHNRAVTQLLTHRSRLMRDCGGKKQNSQPIEIKRSVAIYLQHCNIYQINCVWNCLDFNFDPVSFFKSRLSCLDTVINILSIQWPFRLIGLLLDVDRWGL